MRVLQMLAGHTVLINSRHPAVLSKLLHQPLRMITISMKRMVPELTRDYSFWYTNFIARYLGNTAREVKGLLSRSAQLKFIETR